MQEGKTDAAIDYVERALAFYEQGQYYKETSSALLLLGRAHDYRGEYEAALQALDQQLRLARQTYQRYRRPQCQESTQADGRAARRS